MAILSLAFITSEYWREEEYPVMYILKDMKKSDG